jgi:hypothetical protein
MKLVDKWIPSMKNLLSAYSVRSKSIDDTNEKNEANFSPTDFISAQDEIMEGSDNILSREMLFEAGAVHDEFEEKNEVLAEEMFK